MRYRTEETAVWGQVGATAELVVGAVVGDLAGKAVAERVDPTVEDDFWREAHRNQPYFNRDNKYEDCAPAYRLSRLCALEGI